MSILDLWSIFWHQRLLVLSIVGLFAVGSAIIALLLNPVYRSDVLLAPVSTKEPSGLVGQLGGLASLAGISLGGATEARNSVALLKSRAFAEDFINDHDLMPILYADEWDSASKRWLADRSEGEPTMVDAVDYFRKDVFSVHEDQVSGLVTIAIEWYDPEQAARWVNDLAARINEEARSRAISEAERNLEYLHEQLQQATVVELQAAISRLIESEIQTAMLARAREEYAFNIIDPGVVPTQRSRPHRTLIVLASTVLGGVMAAFVVLLRHSIREQMRQRRAVESKR